MLRNTVIGLTAALPLTLVALTPALADVPQCIKQPNADTCPTYGKPTPPAAASLGVHKNVRHARIHHAPMPDRG